MKKRDGKKMAAAILAVVLVLGLVISMVSAAFMMF